MKNQDVRFVKELPKDSERYAIISVHRTNSTGSYLVGSELQHQQFITLKIAKATYERTLKNDWWFDRDNIIEVSMTLSQWAEFISTPNTSGVPCTLERLQGKYLWEVESVPVVRSSIEQHKEEHEQHWKDKIKEINNLIANLKSSFENKESRKTQRQLIEDLEVLFKNFIPNQRFAINEFNEHIEKRLNQAKTELNSYLSRYGITQQMPSLLPGECKTESIGEKDDN